MKKLSFRVPGARPEAVHGRDGGGKARDRHSLRRQNFEADQWFISFFRLSVILSPTEII